MKAIRLAVVLLLVTLPSLAAKETWYEAYLRGVKAVNAKNYDTAVEALSKAIAEQPMENNIARTRARSEIGTVVYLPHFWLGIAKFQLGDVDAALREWRISEEQGAIAKTDHYSTMKGWVAQAQAAKLRTAQSAAADSKKIADTALSRALSGQMEALSAGGDRLPSYREALRKLQESHGAFQKAGNDIGAYRKAAETAEQAATLFSAATEEAKKNKAARPAVVAKQPPAPQPRVPVPAPQPVVVVPQPQPQPATIVVEAPKPQPQPAAPVESEELVQTRIALQQYRRALGAARSASRERAFQRYLDGAQKAADGWQRDLAKNPAEDLVKHVGTMVEKNEGVLEMRLRQFAATPAVSSIVPPPETDPSLALKTAYRAYAQGELAQSEQLLSNLLRGTKSGEAYLLRGVARYTRAMLSRDPNALLADAASDFKSALRLNRRLRLDDDAFSPKLVTFFESVRNGK